MWEFRSSPNCYISYSFTDEFGDEISDTVFINKFICSGTNVEKGSGAKLLLRFLQELKMHKKNMSNVKLISDFREGDLILQSVGLSDEEKQTKLNNHYIKLGFILDENSVFDNTFIGNIEHIIQKWSNKGGQTKVVKQRWSNKKRKKPVKNRKTRNKCSVKK